MKIITETITNQVICQINMKIIINFSWRDEFMHGNVK